MIVKLLQIGTEIIDEVGFGVIKNAGRTIYGGGQTILGLVTENDEMVENGINGLKDGVGVLCKIALGNALKNLINGENTEEESEDNSEVSENTSDIEIDLM